MILVLALDALDPDLFDRFRAEERLPVLSRLAERGRLERLRSTFPPVSLPAWSTFLTGVGPGRHGLFDFTRLEAGRVHFQNAADRTTPTLLDLLDRAGVRCASIGVPSTYPAAQLAHGAVLSGFDSPLVGRPDARAMHPLELWQALRLDGIDLKTSELPEGRKGRNWHPRARREILASIERRVAQTLGLLARRNFDLMLVHFQAADTAGHHFTRFFDADSPRYDSRYPDRARVIPEVYSALDRAVGRLWSACGDDASLVVVSDHGMGPASDCVVYLNRWLEQQQLLVTRRVPLNRALEGLRRASLRWLPRELQASLFRRLRDSLVPRLESRLRLHHVDRAASAAFSEESSTLPGVWVEDPSREDEIFARLQRWDAVRRVYRRRELYSGPECERAPQLLLELRHSLVRTPSGYRGPAVRRLDPAEFDGERGTGLNGVHRPEGVLLISANGEPVERTRTPWIGDLAPSLLAALGVAIPSWMEGTPLEELAPRPVYADAPADAPDLPKHRLSRRERARIDRRLRALGYLE
ncbi:MAG: alkaline phosphatase family protein [Myxococcota bacterium]|nr:alkaline phosphatase family protein [Myxococcota bacterium]